MPEYSSIPGLDSITNIWKFIYKSISVIRSKELDFFNKQNKNDLCRDQEQFQNDILLLSVFTLINLVYYLMFPISDIYQPIFATIIIGIGFLLIYFSKTQTSKSFFFLICFGYAPLLVFLNTSESSILTLPINIIIISIFCALYTSSAIIILITYLANHILMYNLYVPRLLRVLDINDKPEKIILFENLPSYSLLTSVGVSILLLFYAISRKRMFSKLLETNIKMEELNKHLKELNDNLEECLRTKEFFLISASHELSTLLNVTLGNIDKILLNNELDENIRSLLENSKINCESISYLVNNWIDSSKIERKSIEINPTLMPIENIIGKIWNTTKNLLKSKNLMGNLYYANHMPRLIYIDINRIMQTMFNLLNNSIKFTNNGFIDIVISWIDSTELNENYLQISKAAIGLSNKRFNTEIKQNTNFNSSLAKLFNDTLENINFNKEDDDYYSCFDYSNDLKDHKDLLEEHKDNLLQSDSKLVSNLYKTKKNEEDESRQHIREFKAHFIKNENKFQTKFNTFLKRNFTRKSTTSLIESKAPNQSTIEIDDEKPETVINSHKNHEGFLKIEIIDSGMGIFKDIIEKQNGEWNQKGNKNFIKKFRTGINLGVMKQLIKKMGGDIKTYSEEEYGSTFVIIFKSKIFDKNNLSILSEPNNKLSQPFKTNIDNNTNNKNNDIIHKEDTNENKLTQSLINKNNNSIDIKNNKIQRALIVDDDKTNQEVITNFLEKCNIDFINVASDGNEAVNIFKSKGKNYFSYIFMDLDMPKMNGKKASTIIREYEQVNSWDPVILIIVSGNFVKNELGECLDANGKIRANYFFPKPFTFNQCKNLLDVYAEEKSKKSSIVSNSSNNINLKPPLQTRNSILQSANIQNLEENSIQYQVEMKPAISYSKDINLKSPQMIDNSPSINPTPSKNLASFYGSKTIQFPKSDLPNPAQARSPSMTIGTNTEKNQQIPNSELVLVVDDDQFNTKILNDFLSSRKIECIIANNGKQAVEIFQKNHEKIKLILMDCEMPIMDGYEATTQIRNFINTNNLNNVPIYGVSGHSDSVHHKKCRDTGMDEVIVKPFSFKELNATVNKHIQPASGQQSLFFLFLDNLQISLLLKKSFEKSFQRACTFPTLFFQFWIYVVNNSCLSPFTKFFLRK